MKDYNVLGVVHFDQSAPATSLFDQRSLRKKAWDGVPPNQIQVRLHAADGGELFALLRFRRDQRIPVPLQPDQLIDQETFERAQAIDPCPHVVFGMRLCPTFTSACLHPLMEVELPSLHALKALTESLLRRRVRIFELIRDLAGSMWAQAWIEEKERVHLFFRDRGAMQRGTSGWYIELIGATHISCFLPQAAIDEGAANWRPHVFGIPISGIHAADVPSVLVKKTL